VWEKVRKQEGISLTVKWLCSGVLRLSAKDCVGEGEGRVGEENMGQGNGFDQHTGLKT